MSSTKEQEDLREVILFRIAKEFTAKQDKDWVAEITFEEYIEGLKTLCSNERDMHEITVTAMDEYFRIRTLEAFSFLAKHSVECEISKEGKEVFYYKGEIISKEDLFQNFL